MIDAVCPAGRLAAIRAHARGLLRRGWRDRRGAAAVEFALLVPLLLSLYFVTLEVSQAIETSKKVSRIASMVADLVTQQSSISKSEVEAVMSIGEALVQPYNRTRPTIIVTAVQMTTDAAPKAQVVWSRKLDNGAFASGYAKNSTVKVPAKLLTAGAYLIRVEAKLAYKPLITWAAADKPALGLTAAFDNIDMGDVYFLRPRMSETVPCADC